MLEWLDIVHFQPQTCSHRIHWFPKSFRLYISPKTNSKTYQLRNFRKFAVLDQSILLNRSQSVRVGSILSRSIDVTSGVPQGSVLGPLLFNLFINDIADFFNSCTKIKMFADDLKLYTELSVDARSHFQLYLDHISAWAATWQLGISYSKCHFLELGKSTSTFSYNLNHITITKSEIVTDLGVIIDSNLKFKNHIHDIVNRALLRSSHIFRCFLSRNTVNFLRAYKTYVRPLVEYVSTVWSPSEMLW